MNRKSSDFESVTMVKDDATEAYGGKYQGWRDALVSIPSIYRPIEGLCISLLCCFIVSCVVLFCCCCFLLFSEVVFIIVVCIDVCF